MPMVEQGKYGLLGCVARAEAVGGHVTIQSTPSNGTRLHVIVPFTQAQPALPEQPQSAGD
jgi:signal transduction histidine kinase